jgi:hypothetical protein
MCWLASGKDKDLSNQDVSRWIDGKNLLGGWFNLFSAARWPDRFLPTDPKKYPDPTPEQVKARFAYWLETGL